MLQDFHESSSPKPLKITSGSFIIFLKIAEIFASQGATPVSITPVANRWCRYPVANNWNKKRLLTP
jgi:hypothetical protein